ncbi:MAG: RsmE family RNA methyltransferase [Planctomycetaceae bacterium]
MLPRAYCENLLSDDVTVSDAEAHHLIHVLRCRAGVHVTLFDGQGTEVTAEVVSVTRRDLKCSIRSRIQHTRLSRPELTVIASPPKADRLKTMVEKLTEIGVDRLVLLNTSRTVTTPGETRLDKIHGNMIAACKQCRRPFFMELSPLQSMRTALSELQSSTINPYICIAHPETNNSLTDLSSQAPLTRPAAVLIGPEGGFTNDEVQFAVSGGAVPVSWPKTILRIETAAIVFATLLMSRLDH